MDVTDTLLSLVGGAPVRSAEDLTVALSQAVLCDLGFEPSDQNARWASPGLPQAQHVARLVYVNGSSQPVEAKWVALGPNVLLLVQSSSPGAEPQTISLPVSQVVASAAEFPLATTGWSARDLEAVLVPDAVKTVAAAICGKLIDDAAAGSGATASLPAGPAAAASRPRPQPAGHKEAAKAGFHVPRTNPLSVGSSDLDPLGSIRGGPGEGGGMLMGPGHPAFGQGDFDDSDPDPLAGPQRLPPGAVPPGARFDPISPFRPPPPPGGRAPPRGQGPLSGDPDPDAGMPPNSHWNQFP
ncbi:hypothetical protein GGF46_002368 [Coemansia sp. RSA 552]|nr:hypothetical protein GGF46_002368 [Coemansia sp. RSA 552]